MRAQQSFVIRFGLKPVEGSKSGGTRVSPLIYSMGTRQARSSPLLGACDHPHLAVWRRFSYGPDSFFNQHPRYARTLAPCGSYIVPMRRKASRRVTTHQFISYEQARYPQLDSGFRSTGGLPRGSR